MFTNLHPLEEFCWKVSFCPKVVLFLWLSFFFFLPAPSVPMLLGQLPINGGGGWGYQPSWCADLVIADLLFSNEFFFYQNSYFSPHIKRHWSQWIRNLFKINLFSVCCNSVESAKAPVCNQFSCSEWKPMHKYLFHSFCNRWTCCSQKLIHSSFHLYRN